MTRLSARPLRDCETHDAVEVVRLHLARMLKDRGGLPAHGNQRSAWDAGCRFDHPNPVCR